MHVNSVFTFDSSYATLWSNPEKKANGKIVLVDTSKSMQCNYRELRLCLGMVKALAGLETLPALPEAKGTTNLLGLLLHLIELGVGEQEFLVVTDGMDNGDLRKIQTGVDAEGGPLYTELDKSSPSYLRDRQAAILAFMTEVIRANVHLIGVGNEVKDLLAMAATRPMTVAHVPQNASAHEVASVLNAAVRTSPRATDGAVGGSLPVRIITIDNLEGHEAVAEEVVEKVERAADGIAICNDALSAEQVKSLFESAEQSASIRETARPYTRAVVLWLMKRAFRHGPIPGAFVGGKRGALFDPPPCSTYDWRVNQLLYQLRLAGVLASTKEEHVHLELEGILRTFHKVECYRASERARAHVEALSADRDFCVPEEELVRKSSSPKATPAPKTAVAPDAPDAPASLAGAKRSRSPSPA